MDWAGRPLCKDENAMSSKRWYIFAYDIRDPKRLRQVAKRMEGSGMRLQYSIFRCRLTPRQLERLRWELSRVMDEEDDLMLVPLCDNCVSHCRRENPKMSWPEKTPSYTIV